MTDLAVGDVLEGRYRIDHPIARGGMATVYRCVDLRLGRAVAAKVMHSKFSNDDASRLRFRREARAMAQLSHPNLVGVYDFSANQDEAFLIMELITGGTLRELLAERGPMPPHAAAAVLRAVLTGLSVAHNHGMVHRDIKPDNILINAEHQVKVGDFGLVRAASTNRAATSEIVGTAAYLSPEQVDGSAITAASDVYSTGIVAFELLTGEVPFSGETPLAHAYQRLSLDVPPPSTRIDGIPALVDELIATATNRDPAQRFDNAGEFLAAVDDVAAELKLPSFTVPVPRNSAAHRAAAVPTDMTGIIETTHLNPHGPDAEETSVIEGETEFFDPVPAAVDEQMPETSATLAAIPGAVPGEPEPRMPRSELPEVRPAEPKDPEPLTNRSGWKLWLGIIFAALVTAAVLIGGWWYGSGRYDEIPQVFGMDRTTAITTVTEAGFQPVTEMVYDNDVERDNAVGTNPAEGEKLLPGETVTVLLSRGKPTVPDIPTGISISDYKQLAAERTLEVKTGEPVFSSDIPTGAVAETSPAEGTAVSVGSVITAHISKGPEPIDVPDLSGVEREEAEKQLKEAGLNIGEITERFSPDVAGGHVVTTDPGPGTRLERGNRIDLVISTALTVPDVTGLSIDEAKKILDDAGFDTSDTRSSQAVGSGENIVVSTDPPAGTLTNPDSDPQVVLTLPGKIIVPDITGMSVKDARSALREVGLRIDASVLDNSRTVATQSPSPGEVANRNSRISVVAN